MHEAKEIEPNTYSLAGEYLSYPFFTLILHWGQCYFLSWGMGKHAHAFYFLLFSFMHFIFLQCSQKKKNQKDFLFLGTICAFLCLFVVFGSIPMI